MVQDLPGQTAGALQRGGMTGASGWAEVTPVGMEQITRTLAVGLAAFQLVTCFVGVESWSGQRQGNVRRNLDWRVDRKETEESSSQPRWSELVPGCLTAGKDCSEGDDGAKAQGQATQSLISLGGRTSRSGSRAATPLPSVKGHREARHNRSYPRSYSALIIGRLEGTGICGSS